MGTYSKKLEDDRLKGVRFEIENPDGTVEAYTLGFAHTEVNKKFGRTHERLTRATRAGGKVSPERTRELYRRAFAEAVVIGWEGVTDEDGEPMKFSADNAEKLLTDLPTLYDQLHILASNADNFREVKTGDAESDAKNS